jgi:hypothetical protein
MKAGLATTDLLLAGICRSTHCFKTFIVSLFARDDSNNIGFFLDYESLMLEQNFIFPSSQHKLETSRVTLRSIKVAHSNIVCIAMLPKPVKTYQILCCFFIAILGETLLTLG